MRLRTALVVVALTLVAGAPARADLAPIEDDPAVRDKARPPPAEPEPARSCERVELVTPLIAMALALAVRRRDTSLATTARIRRA